MHAPPGRDLMTCVVAPRYKGVVAQPFFGAASVGRRWIEDNTMGLGAGGWGVESGAGELRSRLIGLATRPGYAGGILLRLPVGPPAAPLVDSWEIAALPAGAPVGRKRHERPAGADEETLHVGLKRNQRREVGEEIRSRRAIAGHD